MTMLGMASRLVLCLILLLEIGVFVIAQESVELDRDVEGRSNGGRACKKQDEKTFHECLKKGKIR